MTKSQYRALRLLKHHGGPMRSTRLAELMGWGRTAQGQARLGGGYFRHLEKKGWVKCGLHGGRWSWFGGTITDAGREALAEVRGVF